MFLSNVSTNMDDFIELFKYCKQLVFTVVQCSPVLNLHSECRACCCSAPYDFYRLVENFYENKNINFCVLLLYYCYDMFHKLLSHFDLIVSDCYCKYYYYYYHNSNQLSWIHFTEIPFTLGWEITRITIFSLSNRDDKIRKKFNGCLIPADFQFTSYDIQIFTHT